MSTVTAPGDPARSRRGAAVVAEPPQPTAPTTQAAPTAPTTQATPTLSISDAARELGVSAHTLRYYERAGLMLEPVDRAHSSHRRYRESDLNWVSLLMKLRATGMPIRDMRRYADLVRAGAGNERTRLELLEAHREAVLAQLDEMQRSLAAIDRKIAIYQAKESCQP